MSCARAVVRLAGDATRMCFVADDYGQGREANEAIEKVCTGRIVRSVTVISSEGCVYSDGFLKSDQAPVMGVHLYLTEYVPLTAALRGLCAKGRPVGKRDILLRWMAGTISSSHVYAEFDAQVARLHGLGYRPQFIDTHQNLHGLPMVLRVVRQVARKYGLEDRIRPSAQLDFGLKRTCRTVLSTCCAAAMGFQRRSRVLVNCPGYGSKRIELGDALSAWDRFLSQVKQRAYELILVPCHPAVSPAETELYLSPGFSSLISKHGVRPDRSVRPGEPVAWESL